MEIDEAFEIISNFIFENNKNNEFDINIALIKISIALNVLKTIIQYIPEDTLKLLKGWLING